VRGRVVVGVDDSPAGLRALRAAVIQARLGHRELVAVRAFPMPRDREAGHAIAIAYGSPGSREPSGPSRARRRELVTRQRQALGVVKESFGQAMGSLPDGIQVRLQVSSGKPGPVLTATACRENDLLVVGAPASRCWRRLFHRSVSHYCAARAACPVVLVPPPELARELGSRHRPWRRHDLDKLLTG
jgi:nucleotide-binding universal stress UspA family protein